MKLMSIVKRVIISIINIIVVVTITFFLLRLTPGDVVENMAVRIAKEQNLTMEVARERVSHILNYDPSEPVLAQFGAYVDNLLHGSLGYSMQFQTTTVLSIIADAFPWTLLVVTIALLLSFAVGCNLGALMAWRRKTILDPIITGLYVFVSSIPYYMWPLLMIVVFCIKLGWFPVAGKYSIMVDPGFNLPFIGSVLYHAAMPIACVFIATVFNWAMSMRASAIGVLGEDYITAAYARSVPERRIRKYYLKKNAMLPLVTSFASTFGMYMGGAIFIETFFKYYGIGYYMGNALAFRDFTLLQGILIISSTATIVALLIADLVYSVLDPRVRVEEG